MTDSEFWQACVVAAIHSGKSAQDGVQMAGYAVAMQPVTPATPSALTYLAEADGVQPTEDDILLAKSGDKIGAQAWFAQFKSATNGCTQCGRCAKMFRADAKKTPIVVKDRAYCSQVCRKWSEGWCLDTY